MWFQVEYSRCFKLGSVVTAPATSFRSFYLGSNDHHPTVDVQRRDNPVPTMAPLLFSVSGTHGGCHKGAQFCLFRA